MLRISKLTDYGTMILVYLADQNRLCPASDVATDTRISLPTVQKLLKKLTKSELIKSVRGAEGGYHLNKNPKDISAADILDALEGPLAITECSADNSACEHESSCSAGEAWQSINTAIRSALKEVSLAELHRPPSEFPLVYTIMDQQSKNNEQALTANNSLLNAIKNI
jgi:FeS assembly SUF system regulator